MNKFRRSLFIMSEINRSPDQADVPLCYDRGYGPARSNTFDFDDLDAKDLELISYCINSNPLIDHSYFGQRLRLLDNLLLGSRPDALGDDRAFLFENGHRCSIAKESQDSDLVSKIFFAILERFKISVHLKDGNSIDRSLIPVGLKATREGLVIKARKSPHSIVRQIPLANVRAITVSGEKSA